MEILEGTQFGRLIALSKSRMADGRPAWTCRCACGATTVACSANLKTGKTKSCGCFKKERMAFGIGIVHGLSGSPEHTAWCGLRERCNNPNHPSYSRYGGRGISVCTQWDSFDAFLVDMGPKPTSLHTIDRINNDGNYEPSNCKWSTKAEQANNRSNSIKIIVNGVSMSLKEASSYLGIGYSGLRRAARNPEFNLADYLANRRSFCLTASHIEQIGKLRSIGKFAREIAAEIGCSKALVHQVISGRDCRGKNKDFSLI